MDYLEWLDEANDRLTRVLLKYPSSNVVIDGIRKHVVFGLARPAEVDVEKLVRDTKGRMVAVSVNYPDLEEDLMPTVEKATKVWGN